jgi:hypothetical protein
VNKVIMNSLPLQQRGRPGFSPKPVVSSARVRKPVGWLASTGILLTAVAATTLAYFGLYGPSALTWLGTLTAFGLLVRRG